MKANQFFIGVFSGALVLAQLGGATAQTKPLSQKDAARAEENYQRYCALCHGEARQGYANDHAPSLRSRSLFSPGHSLFIYRSTAYGRPGTPMGAYRDDYGGPMNDREINQMVRWLYEQAGADPYYDEDGARVRIPYDRIPGDEALGAAIYARDCASCHGAQGEGGTGTALGNPVTLLLASDTLLRETIKRGRDGTPMPAFEDKLNDEELNAVTAFLRSRATGWNVEAQKLTPPPSPDEYVLNPDGADPAFDLQDGLYVSSEDLNKALEEGRRLTLLDTRVASWWQMGHIQGAVPIPYYSDFDVIVDNLPDKDGWIVAYCECPRAAAESVVRKLRARGYKKTAVLWEGIQGWAVLGYPITRGDLTASDTSGGQ